MDCKAKRSYQAPYCRHCKCDLFLEEVYHRGHLYRINPTSGIVDKAQDYSFILPEQERLDYERLVCLKCHRCYEVKRDTEGRLLKGSRF